MVNIVPEHEEWRPVAWRFDGWPYEVSNRGRVRRLPAGRWRQQPMLLKPSVNDSGYHVVSLRFNGKRPHVFVHRLVVEAFIGPIPDEMTVNHKDMNKTNNVPENLEILSRGDNIRHSYRNGNNLTRRRSVLTLEQVSQVRALYRGGMLQRVIADMFGISQMNVSHIVNRTTWKCID